MPDAVPYYNFDISRSQEELAIKLCSKKTEQPFCIYLTQSGSTVKQASIDQAILCLTHPFYYKENMQHILLLAANTVIPKEIKDYLIQHGFNFFFLTIGEHDTENIWLIKQTNDVEQIRKQYENKLALQEFINKWIFIEEHLSVNTLSVITDCIFSTEKEFKQKNPALETLVLTNRTLKEQNNLLSEQNNYLKRELDHYKVFNKQLKEQDESENILRFYHKEYEQLPLWYKRFGHILKILTGKRKLSSLYKKSNT